MFHDRKHVFSKIKDVHVVFGKDRGIQQVPNDENGHAPMWKKMSILWELPYWEVLEVYNAIDVMHLSKNLYVNLIGFLGTYGQAKDIMEARRDLKEMKQRENLRPEKRERVDNTTCVLLATLSAKRRRKACLIA